MARSKPQPPKFTGPHRPETRERISATMRARHQDERTAVDVVEALAPPKRLHALRVSSLEAIVAFHERTAEAQS